MPPENSAMQADNTDPNNGSALQTGGAINEFDQPLNEQPAQTMNEPEPVVETAVEEQQTPVCVCEYLDFLMLC